MGCLSVHPPRTLRALQLSLPCLSGRGPKMLWVWLPVNFQARREETTYCPTRLGFSHCQQALIVGPGAAARAGARPSLPHMPSSPSCLLPTGWPHPHSALRASHTFQRHLETDSRWGWETKPQLSDGINHRVAKGLLSTRHHSFGHQMFAKHLLCPKYCSRFGGTARETDVRGLKALLF